MNGPYIAPYIKYFRCVIIVQLISRNVNMRKTRRNYIGGVPKSESVRQHDGKTRPEIRFLSRHPVREPVFFATKNRFRLWQNRFLWWEEVDSNHRSRRQQIYSLLPLAARESSHMLMYQDTFKCVWWAFRDSNPGPTGYEPVALTN